MLPRNWRKCEPFVAALLEREYVRREGEGLHLCMADGIYLYLYELWQDGAHEGLRSRSQQ